MAKTTLKQTQSGPAGDFDLEANLKKLEAIVQQLENGQLSLQESIDHFSRGTTIMQHCQTAIDQAKQTVNLLVEQTDNTHTLTSYSQCDD